MTRSNAARNRFAAKLEKAIDEAEMSQLELANRLGYENANIITMFKKGTTRVPMDRVTRIANILGLDPGDLLREWFLVYYPDAVPAIEALMGPILSEAEKTWIAGLRRHLGIVPRFREKWGKAIADTVEGKS